jgi:hypothetical protein
MPKAIRVRIAEVIYQSGYVMFEEMSALTLTG